MWTLCRFLFALSLLFQAGVANAVNLGVLNSESDGSPADVYSYKIVWPNGSTSVNNGVLTVTFDASQPERTCESFGANPSASAATNTSAIQDALDTTGVITLLTPGTYEINDALVISSNTEFRLGAGVVIHLTTATQGDILVNTAAVTAQRTVSDGAITGGQAVLTSATASWSAADVGRTVTVSDAGFALGGEAGYNMFTANIVSVDGNEATLDRTAWHTVTDATINVYDRDSNISIVGGTFARATASNISASRHNLFLRRVDKLILTDVSIQDTDDGTGVLNQMSVGDVTDFTITRPHFIYTHVDSNGLPPAVGVCNTGNAGQCADGVHIEGPASAGIVRDVTGVTQDDLVALIQGQDVAAWNDISGQIDGVVVDHVAGISSTGIIKMYPDNAGPSSNNITLRDIDGSLAPNARTITGIAGDGMVIDNVRGRQITLAGYADNPVRDVTIKNVTVVPSTITGAVVFVDDGVVIKDLTVDGVKGYLDLGAAGFILSVSGTADVANLFVNNIDLYNPTDTDGGILNLGGTVGALQSVNVYGRSINKFLSVGASASVGSVSVANFVGTSMVGFADIYSSTTLNLANVKLTSLSGAHIAAHGATTTVNARGMDLDTTQHENWRVSLTDGAALNNYIRNLNIVGVAGATDKIAAVDGPILKPYFDALYVSGALGTPSFTALNLPSSNASPSTTAGQIRHDTTVTGLTGGAVAWWDGTSVRYMVDLDTLPSSDDYVVAYDADADKFYMKSDATGAGYINLTSFVDQTAWRLFYSDGSGDVKELALGADGEYLKSNGASAAPSWATPSGAAHDAVTLSTDLGNNLLGLSTQQLTLDSQTGNYVFAAPNGSSGVPSFRALVDADIPDTLTVTNKVTVPDASVTSGAIAAFDGDKTKLKAATQISLTELDLQQLAAASLPGTITSGQIIHETTNNTLRVGNAAGNAWLLFAPINDSGNDVYTTFSTSALTTALSAKAPTASPTFTTTMGLPAALTNAAATTWTALDNNASAFSIGSTGKADILKVITTDAGEGVSLSGTLSVADQTSFTGKVYVGDGGDEIQTYYDSTPAADDTWSGPKMLVTAGEAIAQWDLLYAKNASGTLKWYKYDCNGTDKLYPPRAIALAAIDSDAAGLVGIGTGIARNDGWGHTTNQDEGKSVWAAGTPGAITLTQPATSGDELGLVGYVMEENVVQFNLGNVTLAEVP